MKKIGILFGMENTFPPTLVEKINSMKVEGVEAEFVKIGGIRMDEPKKYAVIIDRISQDIEFYRAYLKNAALHGTMVVNNNTVVSSTTITASLAVETKWYARSSGLPGEAVKMSSVPLG